MIMMMTIIYLVQHGLFASINRSCEDALYIYTYTPPSPSVGFEENCGKITNDARRQKQKQHNKETKQTTTTHKKQAKQQNLEKCLSINA